MLAEILVPNHQRIRRAIRAHADVVRLEQVALRSGMVGLAEARPQCDRVRIH